MTTEECMTIIQTHHITESNFWGTMQRIAERDMPATVQPIQGYDNIGYCPACGRVVIGIMRYCGDCGKRLLWPGQEETE